MPYKPFKKPINSLKIEKKNLVRKYKKKTLNHKTSQASFYFFSFHLFNFHLFNLSFP